MFAEHTQGERTINVYNTDKIARTKIKDLEIQISYTGDSDAHKAYHLDSIIIPIIVKALNLFSLPTTFNK